MTCHFSTKSTITILVSFLGAVAHASTPVRRILVLILILILILLLFILFIRERAQDIAIHRYGVYVVVVVRGGS